MFIKTNEGHILEVENRVGLNAAFTCKRTATQVQFKDVRATARAAELLEAPLPEYLYIDDGKITEEIKAVLAGQLILAPGRLNYDSNGFRDVRSGLPLGSFTGMYDRYGVAVHVGHILVNPNIIDVGTMVVDVIMDNNAVKFMGASIHEELFELDANYIVIGVHSQASGTNEYELSVIRELS